MAEETNFGRLLEVDIVSGNIMWQFINRDINNGDIYMLSWSRKIPILPKAIDSNLEAICKNQK